MEKKILEESDRMKIDLNRDFVAIRFLRSEHRRYATGCVKSAGSYY